MRSLLIAASVFPLIIACPAKAEKGGIGCVTEEHVSEDKSCALDEAELRFARPSPDLELAAVLAALEVRIGIKAGQIDAWRAYTDALQKLLVSRALEIPGAGPNGQKADADEQKDTFARDQRLIEGISKRAMAVVQLQAAIASLRTTLTSEQLHELSAVNRLDWLGHPDGFPGETAGEGN